MKITYTLEYNTTNKLWVVWKNIKKEHSFNFYPIYEGNKQECEIKLKEMQNGKDSKTKVY